MRIFLSAVSIIALSSSAFAQTVDSQGASQLADTFARYIGRQALDKGVVKIAAESDAYKITFDFKALADLVPGKDLIKFELTPSSMLVKPLANGTWDVSSDMNFKGDFEVNSPNGLQKSEFNIPDGKFTGTYDPALAAFTAASSSISGMTMKSSDAISTVEAKAGEMSSSMTGQAGSGGVDFTAKQTVADFVESLLVNVPESGLKLPFTMRAPTTTVDAVGKGVRSKQLLDLLAFGVANGEEAKIKANQAELKTLLTAALPLWQHVDGEQTFNDFAVESPVGLFAAKELQTSFGADGISTDGKINYAIKATDLVLPKLVLPKWTYALLPTDFELNFGGANIDLDSMAKKSIAAFDLNQDPPLSEEFGNALVADFLAKKPKLVIGHSVIKNADIEVAMEGEMTFEGEKPNADVTISAQGIDKIVSALQEASKDEPELAQYVPVVLMVKGFGKTLPDGHIEWAVAAKPDGSVSVNGVQMKPADPAPQPDDGSELAPGDDATPAPGEGSEPQ